MSDCICLFSIDVAVIIEIKQSMELYEQDNDDHELILVMVVEKLSCVLFKERISSKVGTPALRFRAFAVGDFRNDIIPPQNYLRQFSNVYFNN